MASRTKIRVHQEVVPPGQPVIENGFYYPDSDGLPIADNTAQWDWIVLLAINFQEMFAGRNVFVGSDLLWYPTEGNPKIRRAPDVMIALGRPGGDRRSYRQWREENIAPLVVFEVRSHKNSNREKEAKRAWYEQYQVEEYYVVDPNDRTSRNDPTAGFVAYRREDDRLVPIPVADRFVSPRLGVTFVTADQKLVVHFPDGRTFEYPRANNQKLEAEVAEIRRAKRKETARRKQAEAERAEQERQLNATEKQMSDARARLRAAGLDPADFGL